MNNEKTIQLDEFRKIVEELANETKLEYPKLYFDYAGIGPINAKLFRYDCTPTNTEVFASTGGDGVHYSILVISEKIQPIVMTVPMNFGDSMKAYNRIIGENLNEFLSIGYYNGWFPIEELCYDIDRAIKFYATDNMEDGYPNFSDIIFVKKLRNKFGYDHIPLNPERLKELDDKYFGYLQFDAEFMKRNSKRAT